MYSIFARKKENIMKGSTSLPRQRTGGFQNLSDPQGVSEYVSVYSQT